MLAAVIGPEAVARRIMEKVSVATLAEDRKAGLLELQEKAAAEPVAVGQIAINELCRQMHGFREDVEMLRAALETMQVCLGPEVSVVGADVAAEASAVNSSLFTQENISILLELLEEKAWSTRLSILKIIGCIQASKPAPLQAAILQSPQGLARLMDVLAEENEIVRNEVLLVLVNLTVGNQELNKIMAFEGSFDTLLGVIRDEDEGSVITADCSAIIANLLKGNASNATFFREMGCVSNHIVPLLQKGLQQEADGGGGDLWQHMLQIVGHLLAASTSDIQAAQTHLGKTGVVSIVAEGASRGSISPASKAAGLRLLALLVNRHTPNRLQLSQTRSQQTGQTSLNLLMRLTTSDVPTDPSRQVNVAAAQVFKCFLSGNVDAQQNIGASLMPQPAFDDDPDMPAQEESIGRMIVAALVDPSLGGGSLPKVWGASTVLCAVLSGNSVCQEIAVATPLELPMSSAPPEMFLSSLLSALSKAREGAAGDARVTALMLKLLCVWSFDCSRACDAILKQPSTVMWIVGLMVSSAGGGGGGDEAVMVHVRGCAALLLASCLQSLSDAELKSSVVNVIEARIGLDSFQQHMSLLAKSEALMSARRRELSLQPSKLTAEEAQWGLPLYDADFAALAAKVEEKLQKLLLALLGGIVSPMRAGGGDADLLRERDSLKEQVAELEKQLEALAAEKSGEGGGGGADSDRLEELEEALGNREAEMRKMTAALGEAEAERNGLQMSNKMLEAALEEKNTATVSLQADLDQLRAKLASAAKPAEEGGGGGGDDNAAALAAANAACAAAEQAAAVAQARVVELETELKQAKAANADQVTKLQEHVAQLEAQVKALEASALAGPESVPGDHERMEEALASKDKELSDLKAEMASLKEEHEELLMVLAENGEDEEEEGEGGD